MKFYDLMHGCLTCVRITLIVNKYWIIRNLFLPYTHKTSYSAGWHEHDTLLIGCYDRLKFSLYRGEYFTVCFFRIPLDYPPEYLGSPGETKYPNYSPNSETEPDTDLKNQEPEIRKANDNDIVGPINQIISETLRLRWRYALQLHEHKDERCRNT